MSVFSQAATKEMAAYPPPPPKPVPVTVAPALHALARQVDEETA